MRHITRISLIAALVSGMIACDKQDKTKPEPPRPVKSIVLGKGKTTIDRHFPGKVLPALRADLSFEVAGKLVQFPIKKGEMVKQGQLLAQLDPKPFEDAQQQAKARYTLAKSQYYRGKELIKGNYISRAEYDKLQSSYQVTDANLSTAKRNLKDSTLTSPFTGIIADTYVENHEQVNAKQTLMSLHDITELDIETHVPEKFMLKLKEKKKDNSSNVKVVFDAYPDKSFAVDFKEFSSQADPDTQTYAVVFKMKQPEGINVLPGMSVTVNASISNKNYDHPEYYKLPVSAVFATKGQQSYVWIVNPKTNTVSKKEVTTGNMQDSSIEVLSGLKPGQRVVTAGVHNLRENQVVAVPKGSASE